MGHTHAKVLSSLPGVNLHALIAKDEDAGRRLSQEWAIPHQTDDYAACLASGDIDAVIIASPSGMHVEQGMMAAEAGLPCLIEIPASLDLAGTQQLCEAQSRNGSVMMVAHSRRFSPAHQWLKQRLQAGEFHLYHLVAQTYFLRRTNLNMFGQPRSWADNLLWHHACHSVDLFAWLLGSDEFDVWAQQGPPHPEMGIPMDMTIGMRERSTGQLLSLALSFNNKGPFGGFYRYIGEEETYHAFRDELSDSEHQNIPLKGSAFTLQDQEFFDAIRQGRRPESDIHSVLTTMQLLSRLEKQLNAPR